MFGRRSRPAAARFRPTGTITLSDAAIRERIAFIGLTECDLSVIAAWRSECDAELNRLVDEFYGHIHGTRETWAVIEKFTTVERQRPLLSRYVLSMFQGRIDDTYIAYRRHVGLAHDRIDLESNWYVAMYEVIRRVLDEAVTAAGATPAERREFSEALSRLIQVDIALVVTALTDSRRDRIVAEHREAASFVDAMGTALGRVAERDLTARVAGEIPGQFQPVVAALDRALVNLRSALHDVASSAQTVAGTASRIEHGGASLSQAAAEQAAGVEEAGAALHEITAMTAQTAETALAVSTLSEESSTAVLEGDDSMRRLQGAMAKIDESSAKTAKIVKSIDEIAFQTNLLALNAAVEAARAGNAGLGFAVVAEEVRALALRSAEAARNTAALIEEARGYSTTGVSLGSEVANHLSRIGTKVSRVHDMMQEIATAAREQRDGIADISRTMSQISEVTGRVAENSDQSAAAATHLTDQAGSMEQLLAEFTFASADGAEVLAGV